MRLTSVTVKKLENAGTVKAVASIVMDDEICVNDIHLVEGRNGLFISTPHRRKPNGDRKNIAHPIKDETREKIQEAIIQEYREISSKG